MYPGDNGCSWHRCMLPARYCADALEPHGWELYAGEGLPVGHDVYVIHGLPTVLALSELAKIRRRGKVLVWSVDDDWVTIPDWNPAKPGENGMAVYDIMRRYADYVITSTPALEATFDERKDTVLRAPNLLDVSAFPRIPVEHDDNGKSYVNIQPKLPVRVVWSGGPTHTGDLDPLTEILDEFCAKYVLPGKDGIQKAVLIYFGAMPHPRLMRKYTNRGLFHQPIVPLMSYQAVLNSIDAHVYLAPLAHIPFNESKSNIRVLEGWGLCAAPIASAWGEYNCVVSGTDGRLASTPDEWWSGLTRLVNDAEYRIRLAVAGRMRLEREYDWNRAECRVPWLKVFERFTGVKLT